MRLLTAFVVCLILGALSRATPVRADDRPADVALRIAPVSSHRVRMHRAPHVTPLPLPTRRASRASIAAAGMLRGVKPALAAKAREIVSSCGSRVISGLRRTRVAGSRRWSLHARGLAVDIAGNPSCIYAHLRGWRGGYSVDYARVSPPHVHVSGPGGREDGLHFAHHRPATARPLRYAALR